jgi:hypothetical protein
VPVVAVIAAIVCGVAFLFAGGAKIAAGRGWPAQAGELGAPAFVVPFVPWVEIGVGALLCAQFERTAVALIAAMILLVFSVLLAMRLAQGRRPPCACFGSWSAQPLSWRHLARNAALIVLALVAALA